jgi:hypothetical protein
MMLAVDNIVRLFYDAGTEQLYEKTEKEEP